MKTKFIKLLVLLFLVSLTTFSRSQEAFIKQTIDERLREGDCATAEQLYTAWKKSSGKTDKSTERKIVDCKKGIKLSDPRNRTITVNGVSFNMIYVEGDDFYMGSQKTDSKAINYDPDAYIEEQPVHLVRLRDYYIGETEVTQSLWYAVMGNNPSHFKGENKPVEDVSWDDCIMFIKKINQITGETFSLPTEAEWEYAARGGKYTNRYKYSGSYDISLVAWFWDGSLKDDDKTYPVAQKKCNELGLYDMSGNVWEWCNDCWSKDYNSNADCRFHITRGGGWGSNAKGCRVSCRSGRRDSDLFDQGLRLVLRIKK